MRFFSAALLSVLVAGTVSAAPAVWTEGPLLKVVPSTPAQIPAPARLTAARNEFESFQIVIRGEAPVSGVRARAGELTGPNGAKFPQANVRLYRQALLDVTTPSGAIGARGRFPDGLIPDVDEVDGETRSAFPFDVPAGEARALWVDVLVPLDAPAGLYTGTIQVSGDGLDATVPVELEVLGFALPSTPTLSTAFRAWPASICLAHTGTPDCGSPDTAMALLSKYARLALDHRISLSNIFILRRDPKDSGVVLGKHGEDWTGFDAAFGPLLNGTAATQLPGAKLTTVEYGWERSPEALASYGKHAREKGFLDRAFDYTADEPPYGGKWEDIAPRAATVRASAPGMRTLVTTDINAATDHKVVDSLDILVPLVNHMDGPSAPFAGNQRPRYEDFVRKGGEVWLYQSCMSHGCSFGGAEAGAAWPSYMVDVPAPRNRAMQWVDFAYGATTELYYETVQTLAGDPWASVFDFSGNGDGTLLYPGKPSKIGGSSEVPVPSLRLKHIRDGVEDYEYLAMLVKLGDAALAEKLARDVVPTAHRISDNPNLILEARRTAGRRIAELSAQAAPTPTGPGTPGSSPPQQEFGPGGEATADGSSSPSASGCSTTGSSSIVAAGLLSLVLVALRRRPLRAGARRRPRQAQ